MNEQTRDAYRDEYAETPEPPLYEFARYIYSNPTGPPPAHLLDLAAQILDAPSLAHGFAVLAQTPPDDTTETIYEKTIEGIEIKSAPNQRQHWRKQYESRRLDLQHLTLESSRHLAYLRQARRQPTATDPITITLTRRGPRRLDSDNLQASLKHVRDYLATALSPATQANQHGRRGDDSDPRIIWKYAQETGPPALSIKIDRKAVN